LEKIETLIDYDLNQFSVLSYSNSSTTTLVSSAEILKRNKIFLKRLKNLKIPNLKQISEVCLNKFKLIQKKNMVKALIEKLELIGEDKIIVKTQNEINASNKYEQILVIDWKGGKTVSIIGDKNMQKQDFCWINNLNLILCYQIEYRKESNLSLFNRNGHLERVVQLNNRYLQNITSVFYDKNSFQVYLNTDKEPRSTLVLNEQFELIHNIDHELTDPNFQINFISKIRIFQLDYKIFHFNSKIAFLQEIKYDRQNNDVYVFDKSSYSIIGVIQTNYILTMVFGDKMIFQVFTNGKYEYLVQKIPFINKSYSNDYDAFCKFKSPFKPPHLLSNPHLLPCGHSACLECIYRQYNLFKLSLTCVQCNQEHKLAKQLDLAVPSISISGFLSQNLIHMIIEENKTFISDLGILVILKNKYLFLIIFH
jgi:hypothetical protein